MLERLTTVALKYPRLLITLAVLLVWGQSVRFGFVWDDYFFIEENPAIRSLGRLPEILTTLDAQGLNARDFLVYRPLRTAHYALLYQLGGGVAKPALFHAANLVWHAAAACLLFGVARLFYRRLTPTREAGENQATAFALIAGLAYAVHPVLSETVCWAKSLDDIMAAVFTLLATKLLLGWRGDGWRYAGAIAAFTLAMYSKESAVPWVAFAGLIFWLFHRRNFGRSVWLALPFAGVTLLALVHRHWVIGRSTQTAPISGTHLQTLIDMFPTVPAYARVILGIPPFSVDYSYMTAGHAFTSGAVLLGTVVLLTAIAFTVLAVTRENWRVAGLGGAWFLLFMLPVSNLLPMMQYMAERFLYLPLAGVMLIAGALLMRVQRARVAAVGATVVLALWSAIAWNRSWAWEDELTLFIRTRLECPPMPRVEISAVGAILKQPHMQRVFKLVPKPGAIPFVDVAPPETRATANWPAVKATLREMERQFPSNALALNSAGLGLSLGGEPLEGLKALNRAALFAPPANLNLWRSFGLAYALAGRPDDAIPALERSLAQAPDDIASWTLLAVVCREKKDFKRAAEAFDRLVILEPADPAHARNRDEARVKAAAP